MRVCAVPPTSGALGAETCNYGRLRQSGRNRGLLSRGAEGNRAGAEGNRAGQIKRYPPGRPVIKTGHIDGYYTFRQWNRCHVTLQRGVHLLLNQNSLNRGDIPQIAAKLSKKFGEKSKLAYSIPKLSKKVKTVAAPSTIENCRT